jgi:hypothetical protein
MSIRGISDVPSTIVKNPDLVSSEFAKSPRAWDDTLTGWGTRVSVHPSGLSAKDPK